MTIGRKFSFTSGGLVAAMVGVGVVSIYSLAGLNRITQQIITDPLPGTAKMAAARAATLTVRGDIWHHIAEPNASKKREKERSIEESKGKGAQALQEYEPTITTADDRALFEKLKPAWQRYMDALPAVLALSQAGKAEEARIKYAADAQPSFDAAKYLLQAEMDLNRANGDKLAAESQQSYGRTVWVLAITLALFSLAGVSAAAAVIRSLNRALRQAVSELAEAPDKWPAPRRRFLPPANRWPRDPASKPPRSRKPPPPAKRSTPWPARAARIRPRLLFW